MFSKEFKKDAAQKMSNQRQFSGARFWASAGLLIGLLSTAQAVGPTQVVLTNSVKTVSAAPATGQANPHHAFIAQQTLTSSQSAAPMGFEVALKMRNFAELQARVAKGEHISLQEMKARYEPSQADYDAVVSWITSQGLNITRRDSHHMALFARGTVTQVQQSLAVKFARVSLEGKEYTSATTAPSVPGTLSPLLLGINGLQPHLRAHKHIIKRTAQMTPAVSSASYLPAQIAQAYNVNTLYNSNISGSGQSIAIVIDTFPNPSDLISFWQTAGISQSINNIQFIQAVPGALAAPSGEESLDVEWSSSMAPNARVRVYATTDLLDFDLDAGYQQVYDDVVNHPELGIHQMSMSYGEGETDIPDSQLQTDDQYFAELSAAGVTLFASSGDDGSTPDDMGSNTGPVQVENPASDPYVTGVGGTKLVLDGSNNISTETVWNNGTGATGGGTSVFFDKPSWQTGTGVLAASKRQVPDVSATSDPNFGGIIIVGGVQEVVGGTSWASPMWAAFNALMNQARANAGQGTLGLLGPRIYPLLSNGSYSLDIRDIISGTNGTYSAGTGYDRATGLGSPKMQPLTQTLVGTSPLIGIQPPVAAQTILPGFNATFTTSVSGGSPSYQWQRMPIGTSTWSNLSDNGTYSGSTGAALTITAATTAMSGDQFQCLVNVGGNVIATNPPSVLIVENPLVISAFAGQEGNAGLLNGTGIGSQFNFPSGLAVDSSGNVYVADYTNNNIREITPAGSVTTPYGSLSGTAGTSNGSGNNARFNSPNGVATDSSNNVYVADTGNNLIRKISGGTVSTLGASASFSSPSGVAVDSSGNVYVADTGHDTIRKITSAGAVSILAGQTGNAGYLNGNATTQALFNSPTAVAVDSLGNVYVADFNNQVIRKISSGVVTTIAGQPGTAGYADGPGAKALFNAPIGLAVDSSNNVYVADSLAPPNGSDAAGNGLLRKISPTGAVSTLAGDVEMNGTTNDTGTNAQFFSLQAIAINNAGAFYLADTYNQTIRKGIPFATSPTQIISLSGNLAFGNVPENTTVNRTLKISNTGNTTMTVSSISYPAGFSGNWDSGTIAAGSFQNITVTFAPTGATSYGGTITVTSDATSGTNTIAASGAGIIPTNKILSLSGNMAFGSVTAHATATSILTISNTGDSPLTVNAITYPTGFSGDWSSGTIAPGNSQNVTVTFAPLLAVAYGGNINVNSNATAGANTIAASGLGLPAPVAAVTTTGATTAITALSATLSGTVNPKGSATTAYFQYGTTTGYGTSTSGQSAGSGTANVTFTAGISSLLPQTTYHYRTVVTSAGGTVFGKDKSFKTLAAPTITPNAMAWLGAVGVEVGQSVNSLGVKTTVYFQYGLDTNYGNMTASQSVSGTTAVAIFQVLPALTSNTMYHYRIVTVSAAGTFYGDDATFVTLPFITTPIVSTGAGATGVAGATYSVLGNPAISDSDDVAFAGTMTGSGITTANNSGIWADDTTGTRQLIARIGSTPAPGTNNATFLTLSDPVYNNNEAVAFRGTLKVVANQATSTTATGIWSSSGGSLQLVARQGSPAADHGAGTPLTGATFSTFTNLALPDTGGVLFLATLNANKTAGITTANNTGIWTGNTASDLHLIVRTGETINSKTLTGITFLPNLTYVNGQSRSFAQGTGHLAFIGTFSDKSTGIFKVVGGTPQVVALGNDSAADVSSAQFLTFGNPTLNANDHVAFAATLATGPGGITKTNNSGIWADDNSGTRHLIAQIGVPNGAPLASGSGTFLTLGDPVYDDSEAVAFRGTLKVVTGQATSTTATGIWATTSGSLALVARQGSQAAGCPTGPNGTVGASFSAFTELALPNQGGVVFLATLNTNAAAAVTTANNQGIWAVDTNGNLQLIVRSGDMINGKTITSLKFLPALLYVNGQARSFSQNVGDLVYEATFSDKSSGIFSVTFP